VLGALDWPGLVGQPGDTARDEVDKSLDRYRRSLAQFLHLPTEPLYF
jgi:hypothetical protein